MAEAVEVKVTAEEFAKLPEINLPTELIDGEIIRIPSPKSIHQLVLGELHFRLRQMIEDGVLLLAPMDVYLDEYNVVQPDIFWVSGPSSKCKRGDDDYWHGAPDLVVKIHSEGTGLRDRREKFELYEKHGSREYWLVNPNDRYVEVYQLVRGSFKRAGVYGPEDSFDSPVLGGKKVDLKGVFETASA